MKRRKSDARDKKAGMREGEEVEKRWERKKVKQEGAEESHLQNCVATALSQLFMIFKLAN